MENQSILKNDNNDDKTNVNKSTILIQENVIYPL